MKKINISIIGLGYVGLPLAIEFGKYYNVVGYDVNPYRIKQLQKNNDINGEVSKKEFISSKKLIFTNNKSDIEDCNIYIVTVPTPINKKNIPDLSLIKNACNLIAKFIKKNNFIIFESTVYPGLTKEFSIPLIEKLTRLSINKDFYCGYSPERVNPGDKKRKLKNIKKIVSGSNSYSLNFIYKLYTKIIKAGVHKVSSIEVAEAAKVIENCQRDINIAFVNELSMIFDRMNINTDEVLKAALTKWNFLNFQPGLVGGHCIGVDPYYLTYQAKKFGYNSKIISSGRNVNNNMSNFIVNKLVNSMQKNDIHTDKSNLLIMGFTFKENCKDTRNTKILDVIKLSNKIFKNIDVYDPLANKEEVHTLYNIDLLKNPKKNQYHAIIILVNHKIFKDHGLNKIIAFGKSKSIIYDFKNIFKLKNNLSLKNDISY
ncbi:nucleotide sugar dehydrogenase [Pelagibacteraceae bacterium]|nr:nucleotide sugar dehydrogenase [Pelagibacteraceae bacterium]